MPVPVAAHSEDRLMESLLHEGLDAYAAMHTGPVPEIYERLRIETLRDAEIPQMQVGTLVGRFLMMISRLVGARRAVEVGTFTGYSSLCIAEGMVEGGELTTCDIDEETTAMAQRYWAEAAWGSRITLRLGPALDTLDTLSGPLDLAFIDADKVNYTNYWEAIVPKMRSGGVVIVDNVLWSGEVLRPSDESAHAINALNQHVVADDRVDHVLLTVRDGLMFAVKR
jgi:caffeoyl-CoA O-methyltransferase